MIRLALGFLLQPSPHACDVLAASSPVRLLGRTRLGMPVRATAAQACTSHHPAPRGIQAASGPPSSTQKARGKGAVTELLPTRCPRTGGQVQPQGAWTPETFLTGALPSLRPPFTTRLHRAEPRALQTLPRLENGHWDPQPLLGPQRLGQAPSTSAPEWGPELSLMSR